MDVFLWALLVGLLFFCGFNSTWALIKAESLEKKLKNTERDLKHTEERLRIWDNETFRLRRLLVTHVSEDHMKILSASDSREGVEKTSGGEGLSRYDRIGVDEKDPT